MALFRLCCSAVFFAGCGERVRLFGLDGAFSQLFLTIGGSVYFLKLFSIGFTVLSVSLSLLCCAT